MSSGDKIILADNIAADGSAKHVQLGGKYAWITQAAWDAGDELKLQARLPDGVTWVDISGAIVDANAFMNVDIPAGTDVRTAIVNTPTGITSWLVKH